MAILTEDRLFTLLNVPVSLPQTKINPAGWVGIATVVLPESASLTFRWMQLYISALENSNPNDPCGTIGRNIINGDFATGSIATVFIIKDWTPSTEPWNQEVIGMIVAPESYLDAPDTTICPIIGELKSTVSITTTGSYSVVVLNNTTNRNIDVTVNGAAQVDLNYLADSV